MITNEQIRLLDRIDSLALAYDQRVEKIRADDCSDLGREMVHIELAPSGLVIWVYFEDFGMTLPGLDHWAFEFQDFTSHQELFDRVSALVESVLKRIQIDGPTGQEIFIPLDPEDAATLWTVKRLDQRGNDGGPWSKINRLLKFKGL